MRDIRSLHTFIYLLFEKTTTKEFLQESLLPFVAPMLEKDGKYLREKGLEEFVPKKYADIPLRTKADILNAISLLFVDKVPYHTFRQSLDKDALTLLDALVFNDAMGFEQVEEELGLEVKQPKASRQTQHYYKMPEVYPPFNVFLRRCPNWDHYDKNSYFFIPLALREILAKYYDFSEETKFVRVAILPEKAITFGDSENLFFADYSHLLIYYKRNEISYSMKNRPLANGLAKIQRNLKIKEFFPETPIKGHKVLRTNILAHLLPYLGALEKNTTAPHKGLREFMQQIFSDRFPLPPAVLPHIKGMGYLDNHEFLPFVAKHLLQVLTELPANDYVSMKNIMDYCSYNLFLREAVTRYDAYNRLSLDIPFLQGKGIGFTYYKNAIQLPIIRGTFFLFASLGLCDLIYEPVDPEDLGLQAFSPWDGLVAVRRTRLGDYVCGLTDKYERQDSGSSGISLSDQALLIRLDSEDNLYVNSLGVFAERIGPLSFKTDAAIFLNNIHRKDELIAKIELFKQMAPGSIPANWEEFFNTLKQNMDPLELKGDSILFSVSPDNQELIHLLARDPVLKSLVYKAEGFHVIVPKKNFAALRRRLSECGYLQT